MDSTLLRDTVAAVLQQGLQVRQIAVRREGELVATHLFAPEARLPLWSVSKAFTSMAAGMAMEEGLFGIDDTVAGHFPEYLPAAPDSRLTRVTVRDLLRLTDGHAECPVMRLANAGRDVGDIARLFFAEPMAYEPGSKFFYDNSAWYMVGRLIQKTSGQNVRDYLVPRLFAPLGLGAPQWDATPLGDPMAFAGLRLNAREVALAGEVLLRGGVWEGRRLVPEAYVREMTKPQADNSDTTADFATADHKSGYGYGLWMNRVPGTYRMDGLFGQYCVVLPKQNAVVAYVSEEPARMSAVLELTWDTLMDKL